MTHPTCATKGERPPPPKIDTLPEEFSTGISNTVDNLIKLPENSIFALAEDALPGSRWLRYYASSTMGKLINNLPELDIHHQN